MKIVRKEAFNIALNQLCRRLCHAVRAQMCQINALATRLECFRAGLF